ncbi:G2 and S-phase expressed 1 L homeolog [Xenopus laevis]|uniref:G2 and S-phase expressed 1 L homeolog n=1 Tax=Xenopus laevis TaxID=8355 RepID=Q566H8_XENLA|nr:G2 and S-phase expressed 1 L homeolog [Xenopus laevis]AAH93540.1 MGC114722 protein [Xenopus laevis]
MQAGGDFTLLADEKFDFDISLSPTSSKEGNEDCDDEVFIGPVRHKEKCVRASVQSEESDKGSPSSLLNDNVAWSPLSGDKFVEIFKEAHLVALQLESFANDDPKEDRSAQSDTNQLVEKFVQESKSKLNIFENVDNSKTPIALKRETYCVQESPFNQLPPSVQQRLAMSGTVGEKMSALNKANHTSPGKMPRPTKGLSFSPLVQKSKVVHAKSTVPVANSKKTLSRLQPIKATSLATKTNRLTVEKSISSRKISPVRMKHLSSAGSSEDIYSDKSSVASDISDSSFNSSIAGQNKRTLPAPGKIGLKKTQFKAPPNGAMFRKNTSSSSSSHSSMNASLNSSMSTSPPRGNAKLNTSMNVSINASRLKSNQSRLALVHPSGGSTSSVKNVPDMSKSRLKPSSTVKPGTVGNCSKSALVSVALPKTPSGKMQRQTSAPNLNRMPVPNIPESAIKGSSCSKPQSKVMPTPTSRLRLPQRATGVSPDRSVLKTLQPIRLMSCGDIGSGIAESTPMKSTQGRESTSASVARSVSATPSTKHISSLPTPLSRRTSALMTPRTIPRSISSQRTMQALQTSAKSIKKPLMNGQEESKGKSTKMTSSPVSPTEDLAVADVIPCSLKFSPESKNIPVNGKEPPKSLCSSNKEVLLVDIEELKHETDAKLRKHSSAGSDGYPLIDLSNTPDFNKIIVPIKPAIVGQLIDLSSPLIQLSPVLNKENIQFDSPLLKF